MTSAARVEVDTRRVVVGEQAWSFELDCRCGGVTVDLDGVPLRIRPLRWREKVVLARYTMLGADVVDDQLLMLGLDGVELPPAGPAREAARALALWVCAPTAEELPLSTPLLAEVTVDVCSAIGLAPADLDARDAFEVEALWRVCGPARETARHAVSGRRVGPAPHASQATGGDDTTRILIVPDLPGAEEAPAGTADAAAEGDAVALAAGPPPSKPADRAPAPAPPVDARREASDGDPSPPVRARARRRTTARPEPAAVCRFQPLAVDAASFRRTDAGLPDATPAPRDRPVSAVPGGDEEAFAAEHVAEAGPTWTSRPWRPEPAGDRTPQPPVVQPVTRAGWPLPAPVMTTAPDADELLEELSERLARAADELGIPEV